MKKCDCKHANYCKLENPEECKVQPGDRHFNEEKIMNYTTRQIAEMQGRKGNDLKKDGRE